MTEEERRIKRQETTRARKRQIHRRVCILLLVMILAAVGIGYLVLSGKRPVVDHLITEAGDSITLADFLTSQDTEAAFATDITQIDTTVPGEYTVAIQAGRKEYTAKLTIADTTAPTAQAVPVTIFSGDELRAADCVTDISDATEVTVSFESEPELTGAGEKTATVVLTDMGGNETRLSTTITVLTDTTAPVIEGTKDIEAFVGDTISYKADVTVTDDYDENPSLSIDNSQVDLTQAGTYPVTYTATDAAGNSSSVEITLMLKDKPENYVEPEEVYALAQPVYDQIVDDSMSDMQKAFAIYRWVNTNIGYSGDSDKSDWTIGAYDAFTNLSGDCYNYFAAAKALFNLAGIENIDIVKSDTSHSSHFWSLINLGYGWYHVDCTPRKGDGDNFFMVTDAELEAYSSEHHNSHIFDPTLYPERATESVQDKVDYENGVLNE